MAECILKTSSGYKTISGRSQEWLQKMWENPNFVFGYLLDGTFAVGNLVLLEEYQRNK